MPDEPFPDPAPNTHSVAFRLPFTATAEELKEWFATKIKHRWRIAHGGKGMEMRVVRPRRHGEWRLTLDSWEAIVHVAQPFHDDTYYSIVANFDDAKDAMLFKLTWG